MDMRRFSSIPSVMLAVSCIASAQQVCDVTSFGARGDGKTLNTTAVQAAIDTCARRGGGTVYVPAGTFVTGTLQLRSHVTLELANGAVLLGSERLDDYVLGGKRYGIVYAVNSTDLVVKGEGVIDGRSSAFNYADSVKVFQPEAYKKFTRQGLAYLARAGVGDGPIEPHPQRPYQMLIFSNCTNVRVEGVTLRNSPFWTLHLADCDHATVSNVKIHNDVLVANSDGIDCTSCSNVLITNCEIIGGDDAIVLNSYSAHFDLPGFQNLLRPSENIVVSNCVLLSRSSGIRIGGIDHRPMKNYLFSNIVIYNSNRGIGLFTGIEGGIENASFSDIIIETRLHTGDWWGKAEPIHIQAVPTSKGGKPGAIKDIRFRNIKATSESGVIVYATEKDGIRDLSFDQLDLCIVNGPSQREYGGNFDLRPADSVELNLFCHDIPGIYLKNVKGIKITNSRLRWGENMESFFRYGVWAEDVEDAAIEGFDACPPPATAETMFYLERVGNVLVQNCTLAAPEKTFLITKDARGAVTSVNNRFVRY